ncbi:hypothetical protein [Reyranella sp.]|uniref:hypothetical protein n=1 Tax=Reyranella sp. TaxID=1929291 RepID=UPI003783434E
MQRAVPVASRAANKAVTPVGEEERTKHNGAKVPAFADGVAGSDYAAVPLQATSAGTKREAEDEDEAVGEQGLVEIIPKDKEEAHAAPAGFATPRTHTIRTILRKGRPPETLMGSPAPLIGDTHHQTVAPSGSPTTGSSSNDCTPATSTISFDAVSADADNWRVDVTALTLQGQVNVADWPSKPTDTATPNTANPVDGGNITSGNFQSAIDDMADYNTVGGGRGPNWHSTAASSAHEWAHWNTDWVADSIGSAKGGNWSKTNQELDAIKEPKSSSADAAAAKAAMQGRVSARLTKFDNAATKRWNAIPDSPGVAGSTGYIAGAAVLATLISSVRTYATSKGWTGTSPAPGP